LKFIEVREKFIMMNRRMFVEGGRTDEHLVQCFRVLKEWVAAWLLIAKGEREA